MYAYVVHVQMYIYICPADNIEVTNWQEFDLVVLSLITNCQNDTSYTGSMQSILYSMYFCGGGLNFAFFTVTMSGIHEK